MAASTSPSFSNTSTSSIWEPMWACSPHSSSPAASHAAAARGTSSIGKPNLESTCPVWM